MALPPLATFQDVDDAFEEDLDTEQRTWVENKIARASRMLRRKVPGLDARVTSGKLEREAVVDVIAEAVLRIIRNPAGLQMEMEGNYSYQARASVAGGDLRFLPDELALLRKPSTEKYGRSIQSRVPAYRRLP